MIKNQFKIALRYLFKHKFFTGIHVLCLALGITFSMIVGVYVLSEYSVNRSLKFVEDQYIVKSNWKEEGMGLEITTLAPLAKTLYEEYPSLVANYYRYNPVTNVVSAGDQHYMENIAIGDTTFIHMYGFPVLYGDKKRPFTDNHSAVITASMATKLFGHTDAVNETISIHTTVEGVRQDYHVSAVIQDIPYNSVTNLVGEGYSVFVPTEGNLYYGIGDPAATWDNPFEIAMIQLHPGITREDLVVPCEQVLAKYTPETVQENLTVELASVKNYHLDDNDGAARRMITILSLSAMFILLMAIINFVNISVGTSAYRLKEIGLRKVFGGSKKQLIAQFLSEAILLTGFATALALPCYELLRPLFNEVLNTQLTPLLGFGLQPFLFLLSLALLIGIIAGLYPAFILSSSHVITSVKGKIDNAKGNLSLRKSMLVVQFVIAITVLTGALIVSRQVSYIFNKDIGYEKEQVMIITAFPKQWNAAGVQLMEGVKDRLSRLPSVQRASLSFEVPDRQPPNAFGFQLANGEGPVVMVPSMGADADYAETFGLTVLSGVCFNPSGGHIPDQVVLNESAIRSFGMTPESAINQRLRQPSSGNEVTVVGVVKDFNYSSLQQQIGPIAFFHIRDFQSYRFLSLKLNTTNMAETISQIEQEWKTLLPAAPFEYTFMDEQFASLYRSELQLERAAQVATGLNLTIVFLGIFGVVTFTLAKRTKEIAVRKVFGAKTIHITTLFIRDYAQLILLANIIAWPLTYVVMEKWLEGYAYRIQIQWWMFVTVGLAGIVITVLTVGGQTMRAALAKPADSLKNE